MVKYSSMVVSECGQFEVNAIARFINELVPYMEVLNVQLLEL